MQPTKTAVVTGGAGVIGSHVVDRLLQAEYSVTVIDNMSGGKHENIHPKAKLVVADVTTTEAATAIQVARPELIVHAAAQISVSVSTREPLNDAQINVLGTLNVLEAARAAETHKIVYFGSGGTAYGQPQEIPVGESHPTAPENPYGMSKLTGELYLDMYRRVQGLDSTVLRLANIYGPRQDPHGEAGVIAIFAQAMLSDSPVKIFGDGNDERDYVFVSDVVDAVMAAIDGGPDVCNIGSGIGTNVNELCAKLAALTGYQKDPQYDPPRPGDIHAISLDASLAEATLGWSPKINLDKGLALTVEFFKRQVG